MSKCFSLTVDDIRKDLVKLSDNKKAKVLASFFKTGPGQYGQGDIFIGITVPQIRELAKKYSKVSLSETIKLLKSPIHEQRVLALIILVVQFKESCGREKRKIFNTYLNNTKYINNWDLVDLSCPSIVGDYLSDKDRKILYKFARSPNLWQRRIAIVSTFYFIKNNYFNDTIKISQILLKDSHDLIHKAVGWMLREVGKRDRKLLENFLKKYHKIMPRTMLRYAIEKFSNNERKIYLKRR